MGFDMVSLRIILRLIVCGVKWIGFVFFVKLFSVLLVNVIVDRFVKI